MTRRMLDDAPAADEPRTTRACVAQRCPAMPTIFDTLRGEPSAGRCRYHDAAPPHLWPAVTALLLRSESIEETNAGLEALRLRVRVPQVPTTYTPEERRRIRERLGLEGDTSRPMPDAIASIRNVDALAREAEAAQREADAERAAIQEEGARRDE